MTKADRIQAIERIIEPFFKGYPVVFDEKGAAIAIEEAIGVIDWQVERIMVDECRNDKLHILEQASINSRLKDLAEAISTNKEVISIKEEHNE